MKRLTAKHKKERKIKMAKVGIVMGSDSDLPIMSKACEILDKLGVEYDVTVISAHRMPDVLSWILTAVRFLLWQITTATI